MSGGTAAPGAPLTDGRILRAERTRRLVVESFLDLVQAGELRPTARQVSDRSGVSMRSIFRLFEDVDALHAAAIVAHVERVAHLFEAPDPKGSVGSRTDALVEQRTRLYETIAPVRRMAIRLAPRSRPIAAELAHADVILRDHLAPLFAPELTAHAPGSEGRGRRGAGRHDELGDLGSPAHQPTTRRRRGHARRHHVGARRPRVVLDPGTVTCTPAMAPPHRRVSARVSPSARPATRAAAGRVARSRRGSGERHPRPARRGRGAPSPRSASRGRTGRCPRSPS